MLATSGLLRCLAEGSGHWEAAPNKTAPYILERPPRVSRYAPQACDKPGKRSTRRVLQHTWVPDGPRCASLLHHQHGSWLNSTLESLASRFCRRHSGSRILLVGDSIMSQWFIGLAAALGEPSFSAASVRACAGSGGGGGGSVLDYDVGQTARVCGGHVELQYVRNGVLDVNASAEEAARASHGRCVADPASTNQPWLYLVPQHDFVVLNRGVWVEENAEKFEAELNATIHALALARHARTAEQQHEEAGGAVARARQRRPPPRVVWRGTPASIPRCWRLRDPLPTPFEFNFSAAPSLATERGVALFKWHHFAPQNGVARRLVEAAGHAYLDTYTQTALRPGGHHPSRHDCVHWCLPGPPDEWTRLLLLLWLHDSPARHASSMVPDQPVHANLK